MVLKMSMAVWVAPPLTAASSSALAAPGTTTWLAAASTCTQEHMMHLPSTRVPTLSCELRTVTIDLLATQWTSVPCCVIGGHLQAAVKLPCSSAGAQRCSRHHSITCEALRCESSRYTASMT